MTPGEVPAEIVTAAQLADAEWNRTRVRDGRGWGSVPGDQVRRLIAGAVTAERERCAELAEEHKARYPVTFTGDDRYLSVGSEPFADLIREQQ